MRGLTEKDVKILLISESSSRLNALSIGRIDDAILPPPFSVQAEKMGLKRLIGAAEVPEISMELRSAVRLGVHAISPEQPRNRSGRSCGRFEGARFHSHAKNDTVKIISDWLKVDSRSPAAPMTHISVR
jgi:hypothetical protein